MSKLYTSGIRASQGFSAIPSRGLMTPEQAAEYLQLSPHTLRKMARRGEIPALRLGDGPKAHVRFERWKLEAWVKDRAEAFRREVEK